MKKCWLFPWRLLRQNASRLNLGDARKFKKPSTNYIFGSIKHPAAPSFELRVPEKRKTIGRSSLYLHRRAIQRSTVQFVMICGERGWCERFEYKRRCLSREINVKSRVVAASRRHSGTRSIKDSRSETNSVREFGCVQWIPCEFASVQSICSRDEIFLEIFVHFRRENYRVYKSPPASRYIFVNWMFRIFAIRTA